MNQQTPKLANGRPGLAKKSVDSSSCHVRIGVFAMSRVVFFLIGLLLSVTAGLKLWMLLTDPFADIKTGFPTIALWLAVFSELIVVTLLVSRAVFAVKFTASFVLFLSFLLVSAVRLVAGYRDCGCLGSLNIPPSVSVGANIQTLLLLILGARSQRVSAKTLATETLAYVSHFPRHYVVQLSGALAVIIAFLAVGPSTVGNDVKRWCFPSTVNATAVRFDQLTLGVKSRSFVYLNNTSTFAITVVGSAKSCACVSLAKSKMTLQPKSTTPVEVEESPKAIGPFHQRIIFYLDSKEQSLLNVNLSGFCERIRP